MPEGREMQKQAEVTAKILEDMKKQQEEKIAGEIIERQIKILSASYDKVSSYTNLIILGGYAGYFGLWQLTKEFIGPRQAFWSALWMLCSLCVFVFFEVYKMASTTIFLGKQSKILQDPDAQKNPLYLLNRFKEYEASHERHNISYLKIWRLNVFAAVVFAALGIGILMTAFILGLHQFA